MTDWVFISKAIAETVDNTVSTLSPEAQSSRDRINEIAQGGAVPASGATVPESPLPNDDFLVYNPALPDFAQPSFIEKKLGTTPSRVAPEKGNGSRPDVTFSGPKASVPLKLVFSENAPQEDRISGNVLDNFLLPKYTIVLTMLSQETALRLQQGVIGENDIDVDTLRSQVARERSAVLASSGEIFRNTTITGGTTATVRQQTSTATVQSGDDYVPYADPETEFVDPETGIGTLEDRPSRPATVDHISEPIFETSGQETQQTFVSNYYNIKSLHIENVYAPSPDNPMLSTLTLMKMKIVEPHGFKLHEDIRNLGGFLGYGVNTGRILYRVDIFFSGYDPSQGKWLDVVPLSEDRTVPNPVSYVMAIAKVEASVESAGTSYDVDLVPAAHFAYRPEEITLEANTIFTGEQNTFGSWLDHLGEQMKLAKKARTRGLIEREYKFYVPEIIKNARFDARESTVFKQYHTDPTKNGLIIVGKDIDLFTLIRMAMSDLKEVQDYFIADLGNEAFLEPRVHFTLRFNTKYSGTPKTETNDYTLITYEYIIEPYITYKKGTVTPKTTELYTRAENQVARVNNIIKLRMIQRVYNYLYTALNTDVISFDLKFTNFYYEMLNTFNNDPMFSGIISEKSAAIINSLRNSLNAIGQAQDGEPYITLASGVSTSISQTLANDSANRTSAEDTPIKSFDVLGGSFDETPDNIQSTSRTSMDQKKASYLNYLDDYLSRDLLVLKGLVIRGDPIWLLSGYANSSLDPFEPLNPGEEVPIYPRTDKMILLRIFAPNQDDYMDPNRNMGSSNQSIIGGFYKIYKVTSTFENGVFQQELEGGKVNHLNYVEQRYGVTPATS